MRNTTFRAPRKVIGILALAALVSALTVAVASTEGDDKTVVTATFSDASPLVEGNFVQMNGVVIGEISSMRVADGVAEVRMRVDKAALPLHEDAKARVQVRSLLGERYIELDRGTVSAPQMEAPFTIAQEFTERQVSLNELLDTVDDPTGTALAAFLTTLGEGTAGQGKNIDAAIQALEPAMRNTGKLGNVLGQQNEVLASLVDKLAPVAGALAEGRGAKLDHLVGSTEKTLSALDSRRQALKATLARLPATLRQAQHTLAEVADVADATTGTLHDVRPVTENLSAIVTELNNFTASANPALTSLPGVLEHARKLIEQATPAVRDLRPGAKALESVSASANETTAVVDAGAVNTALEFARFWALANNSGDGLSNYFRAALAVTPKELLEIVGVPTGPEGSEQEGKATPDKPAPQPPAVGVPGSGERPAPDVNAPDGSKDTGQEGGSMTGLTRTQERSLLGQLLGGL